MLALIRLSYLVDRGIRSLASQTGNRQSLAMCILVQYQTMVLRLWLVSSPWHMYDVCSSLKVNVSEKNGFCFLFCRVMIKVLSPLNAVIIKAINKQDKIQILMLKTAPDRFPLDTGAKRLYSLGESGDRCFYI